MNKEKLRDALTLLKIEPTEQQLSQFGRFYEQLLEWNARVNLTAITAEEEVLVKHFYDSLLALQLPEWEDQGKIVDVGTGAGFPGIPLKIVRPQLEVHLLDSLNKRVLFLEHIITTLNLENTAAFHQRAEEAGQDPRRRERYDVAVSRAVARLPVLLEYCLPLVRPGGYFIAYKGPEAPRELEESQKALRILQGEATRAAEMTLPQEAGKRMLVVIRKTGHTPAAYPRKAGLPEKKPL